MNHCKSHCKKLLLTTLFALTLVGCQANTSSTSSGKTSDTPTSEKNSSESSKPAPVSSSKNTTSSTTKGNEEASSSSSASSDDPYKSGWARLVVDNMQLHLGGQIVPYVTELGNCDADWSRSLDDYGKLYIYSEELFTPELIVHAKQVYEDAGWSVESGTTTFIAKNDTLHLTVEIKQDDSASSDSDISFVVTYDEPYDTTKGTDWDSSLKKQITDNFSGHSLGYVYLGTQFVSAQFSEYNSLLSIKGGKWNDQILTDAPEALKKIGFSDAKVEGTGNARTVTATKTETDGCNLSVTIRNYSAFVPTILMEVKFNETYNPEDLTDWDSSTKNEMTSALGHNLPFVYLGTKSVTTRLDSEDNSLTITGNTFKADMFTNAKTAFEADHWDIIEGTNSFGATKKFDDGETIFVYFGAPYDGRAAFIARSYTALTAPTGDNAKYSDTIKADMNTNLGVELPYVYLGATALTEGWDGEEFSLRGDVYNEAMITSAIDAFKADGKWTTTVTFDKTGRIFTATQTINGNTVTVTLKKPDGKYTYLKAKVAKEFKLPEQGKSWDDDSQITLMGFFDWEYEMPYVYLNTDTPSCSGNDTKLTLVGGAWNDQLIGYAKTSLESSTSPKFTVTVTGTKLVATCTLESGATITVTLESQYGDAVLTLKKVVPFDIPTGDDAKWDDDTTTAMKNFFGGDYTLPFMYLGSGEITSKSNSSYEGDIKYLTISSESWDDRMITNAKSVLNADTGWEITTKGKTLGAYKRLTDGSYVRFKLTQEADEYYGTTMAKITAYHDAAVTIPTDVSSYKNDVTLQLNSYLGEDASRLPFFYLGADDTLSIKKRTVNSNNIVYLQNSAWNSLYTLNAYNVLKAAGWNCTLTPMDLTDSYDYYFALEAHSKPEAGKADLAIKISGDSNHRVIITKTEFTPSSATSWSDGIQSAMSENLDGNIIPYFYLGTDDVTYSIPSEGGSLALQLTGKVWNDSLFTLMKKAVDADTKLTWDTMFDYTSGKSFRASAYDSINDSYLTLVLEKEQDADWFVSYPTLSIYYTK